MLMRPSHARGVTLVEIVVVLGIVALLTVLSVPSMTAWFANSRIRTTAEAIQSGLQLAKSEAVSRNARVRFQLTSTLDNACAIDVNGLNWVVNLDPNANPAEVEGRCAAAPIVYDPNAAPAAPFIIQKRPATGSAGAQVVATGGSIVFNGLGRPVPAPAGNLTIAVTFPANGTCTSVGGELTCLSVVVTPAGQIRMCNPAFPATDPQGC